MNPAPSLLLISLLCYLSACHAVRTLPVSTIGAVLPQTNGYFAYLQADTLRGVTMPEINRVAQAWISQHTKENGFAWQPPVYKAELLYAGQIRPESIPVPDSDYFAKRSVHYYLTVSAKDGLCRLMLTNFTVDGAGRGPVALEKLVSDQALCRAVEGEATTLLQTMAAYVRRNASKSILH